MIRPEYQTQTADNPTWMIAIAFAVLIFLVVKK